MAFSAAPRVLGGIEAGGTTFVVCVALVDDPTKIIASQVIDTTTPEETLRKTADWLKTHNVVALGIASFGPLDCTPSSPTYGFITSTPKPGWGNTDILGFMKKALGPDVPVGIETDVIGAAMGEFNSGGHGEIRSCTYVTVGTGIGAGTVLEGRPLKLLAPPEAGHMMLRPHKSEPEFEGTCSYHGGHCAEGLAASEAMTKRLGLAHRRELATFSDDSHPGWDVEAFYLAQLCVNLALTLVPDVICLGGGLLHRKGMYDSVRKHFTALLNGYVAIERVRDRPETYIVPPALGSDSGAVGALMLADQALKAL